MKIIPSSFLTGFALCFALLWQDLSMANNEFPRVVVSITPFYALVADLMQGVGTPELLVKPGASPHEYALKPSDIQKIKHADLIFWAGPELESFLTKALKSPDRKPNGLIVELVKTPQLKLLPLRLRAPFEPHDHTNHSHADEETDNASLIDMHFWLDPNNAILLTQAMVNELSKVDPAHAIIYQKNGNQLKIRLNQLDKTVAAQLKNVKIVPFLVFHDAYQYFEYRYGLNGVGAITLHPEITPSAKRLNTIREIILSSKAKCIFTEPQFQPKLVQSIIQDLKVQTAELDPLGTEPLDNKNGYFTLLENLTSSLKRCLDK